MFLTILGVSTAACITPDDFSQEFTSTGKKGNRKPKNRRHSKAYGGSGLKARNSQQRVEAGGGQCWSQCQKSDSHVEQRSLLNKHKKTRMSSDFSGGPQRSGGQVVFL